MQKKRFIKGTVLVTAALSLFLTNAPFTESKTFADNITTESKNTLTVMETTNPFLDYSDMMEKETIELQGYNPSVVGLADSNKIGINAQLYTGSYQISYWNWNNVSPISDFIDNKGRYTIAYSDDNRIYISHINDDLAINDTVTFGKPMPLIGAVTNDSNGNFYVVCGQEDTAKKAEVCTAAVYKYSNDGEYIGKAEYICQDSTNESFGTQHPFEYGNCATAFYNNILICSFARMMYNGHQSNHVFCVDIDTMTPVDVFYNYCSHSFNQSVISLSSGGVAYANHGDAYPRGFQIEIYGENNYVYTIPFVFYGEIGFQRTNARLTGIAELGTGLALVGSSAKSYSPQFTEEKQQMFLQIIDMNDGGMVLDGYTRENGDTGILWLTDYSDGSEVRASATAALDPTRLLVMWERWSSNGEFIGTYYSIISSEGEILFDSIPIGNIMLNGAEELKHKGDVVYWTYADGTDKTAEIYRLNVSDTLESGDVDGNGRVNDQDSILLSRYLSEWGNDIYTVSAGMNGDGKVNDQDSIFLARMLAGWYN